MNYMIDEKGGLNEGDENHEHGRGITCELLGIGEGISNALQRRSLLCRQSIASDDIQKVLWMKS